MKRFSIVAIGIVFLVAGLCTQAFAGPGHDSSPDQAVPAKSDANSALSIRIEDHIKEIYTTLTSSSSYNAYAVKVFYTGESIDFVARMFLNNPGPIYVYTIITDVGGKVVLLDGYGYTPQSSDWAVWFSTNTMPSGTYSFSILISTNDGLLLSPTPFTFVVL